MAINARPVMTREQAIDEAVRRVWLPLRQHMAAFSPLFFANGSGQMPGLVDGIRAEFRRIVGAPLAVADDAARFIVSDGFSDAARAALNAGAADAVNRKRA